MATEDRIRDLIGMTSLGRATGARDEALFAARHDTPEGQYAMQAMHDEAGRRGAVCNRPKAEMVSRHESDALQQMHDLAVENGARCSTTTSRPAYSTAPSVTFTQETDDVLAGFVRGDADPRQFILGFMHARNRELERQVEFEQRLLNAQRQSSEAARQTHVSNLASLTPLGKALMAREKSQG